MTLSQRCYYALRAIYELAKAGEGQSIKIAQIAERQRLPLKFLEAILNELKKGHFVESRRGNDGGYLLARPAHGLTVGEIIRFVEGPLSPMKCTEDHGGCGVEHELCVFAPIWTQAEQALTDVYDSITFQDLVDRNAHDFADDFVI